MDTLVPEKPVTHLGIGAHPDDLEFMALSGILECYGDPSKGFAGVTCTDGRGSVRPEKYATLSEEEFIILRAREQERAAQIGDYSYIAQLGYSSEQFADLSNSTPTELIREIILRDQPQVIYTHNPYDRHQTHTAVFKKVVNALHDIPVNKKPIHIYGCEVWGSLDWLSNGHKIRLDCSENDKTKEVSAQLWECFDSQLQNKRYDLAVAGRLQANATFDNSHQADNSSAILYALDLQPFADNPDLDPAEYRETLQ